MASVALCTINGQIVAGEQTPAFPGAEGHGRYTTGGRGGKVVRVTTLEDYASGQTAIAGSLRWALQQSGDKTIVFDVSGTIHLKQELRTAKDNLTIAGQTAPGDGICLADYPFVINSNNVIIRYMRFRPGDASGGEPDGLGGMDKKNIIIDHCSISWSVDECLSVYGMENLTVQWCLASEALRVSTHSKSTHCYGGNWGGNKASYHHNMIAHCESRTPRLGPRPSTQMNEYVDIRNNVFYNWAGNGCYGGEGMNVNIVNNYYKPGPATDKASSAVKYRIAKIGVRTEAYVTSNPSFAPAKHIWGKFYINGNVVDGNAGVSADNWTNGVYAQQTNDANVDKLWTQATKDSIRLSQPLKTNVITTHTAAVAYEKVLDYVGCSLHRDEVDQRIVEDTRRREASFTASGNKAGYINTPTDTKPAGVTDEWTPWPSLTQTTPPVDSDGDGMPDEWEDANGLNKNNKADGLLKNPEGYTNFELYINSLVDHITTKQNEGGVGMLQPEVKLPSRKIAVYTENNIVYLENLLSARVEVLTLNSIFVAIKECVDGSTSFNLPSGVYIIRVLEGESVNTLKIKV